MRQLVVLIVVIITNTAIAQNTFEWDGIYQLKLSDFQSTTTQIGGTNIYSLSTGSTIDFLFYMSNAEFMFTKNFNSKVTCSYNRNIVTLVAPDSSTAFDLLCFARYDFDLSELYARKLRKKLMEEKGTFSDVTFFKPVYEDIQQQFSERRTIALKITDLGRNKEQLMELHTQVLSEIEQLADFCKTCKASKKKK